MSRFSPQSAMPVEEGSQVNATVKWFNISKGFGFVAPADGTADAFLHISVLNRAGLQAISEGAEISCFIAPGAKGPQVTRIVEVINNPSGASSSSGDSRGFQGRPYRDRSDHFRGNNSGYRDRSDFRDRSEYRERSFDRASERTPTGPEQEMSGTVKWFKNDKGFGFLAADDSGHDVFVHKSVLDQCGIMGLDSGQRLQMRVRDTSKGREATWIAVLTGQLSGSSSS